MQSISSTVAGHLYGSTGVPCPTVATSEHSWFLSLWLLFGLPGLWLHLGAPVMWPHWAPPSFWWLYCPHSSEWTTELDAVASSFPSPSSTLVLGSPGSISAHRPCRVTLSLPPSGFAWFSSHPDSTLVTLSPGSALLIPTQESLWSPFHWHHQGNPLHASIGFPVVSSSAGSPLDSSSPLDLYFWLALQIAPYFTLFVATNCDNTPFSSS